MELQLTSTSQSPTEFPLWALLTLYERSNKVDTYCDNFAGFRALVVGLAPIERPQRSTLKEIPWYRMNYTVQRMAMILNVPELDLYEYITYDYARHYNWNHCHDT